MENDENRELNEELNRLEEEYDQEFHGPVVVKPEKPEIKLQFFNEEWPHQVADEYKDISHEECNDLIKNLDVMFRNRRDKSSKIQCSEDEINDYIKIAGLEMEKYYTRDIKILIRSARSMLERISVMRSTNMTQISEMLLNSLIKMFVIEKQKIEHDFTKDKTTKLRNEE